MAHAPASARFPTRLTRAPQASPLPTAGLDLNLVAIFAKVVELGSFTAAGGALGLPKSSVSRQLARLEESLGVRLLQRTTRKLGLTEAGERYLAEVRGPLTRLAEATSEVAELTQEPRGKVRLSIAPEPAEGGISAVLVEFARRYPRIQVELVVTNRRVNLIEEGIDLALRGGLLDDSTLVARRVAVSELGLYAAPQYLQRRGAPRRLSDLTEHDCVPYRASTGLLPYRLTGPRGMEQVAVNGPVIADDLGSVRLLTLGGLGIALLPDMFVRWDVERGALVRVLPAYASRGGAVYLISPPLRHVPARVILLRDFLIQELGRRLAGTPCDPKAVSPVAAGAGDRSAAGKRLKAVARR